MSRNPWLAWLKNERAPEMAPTEPTKPRTSDNRAGSVGFAGPESATTAKIDVGEVGGFVGFAGASSGAEQKSQPRADAGAVPVEDSNAHAREEAQADPAQRSAHAREHPGGELHAVRFNRFLAVGMVPARAEAAADRLAIRDADLDDRRMCVECTYYGARRRCIAAATGRLAGVPRDLEPVPDLLQRCEAFGLRKGLV